MIGFIDEHEQAANELAKTMRGKEWYHRTSFELLKGPGRLLVVWGEHVNGNRPAGIPDIFRGFPVTFRCVSSRHPCPFGSVRDGFMSESP